MPLKIAVYASCNYVLASLRRSAVVTLACISGFLICTARVNAGDQEVLLTGYSVRTWNQGDRRPRWRLRDRPTPTRLFVDRSDAGLFRFDGSRFTAADDINERHFLRLLSQHCVSLGMEHVGGLCGRLSSPPHSQRPQHRR